MRVEPGSPLPLVVHPVDIGNRDSRQLLFADALEAAEVHAVHRADRRVVADPERPDAADLAEEVLVLLRVEPVLGEHLPARQQAELLRPGHRGPEAVAAADRAIAAVGRLRQVEVGLEAHRAAVATALVRSQHWQAAPDRARERILGRPAARGHIPGEQRTPSRPPHAGAGPSAGVGTTGTMMRDGCSASWNTVFCDTGWLRGR